MSEFFNVINSSRLKFNCQERVSLFVETDRNDFNVLLSIQG
jgi:hypothetical protein